jgi:hypothetical protein
VLSSAAASALAMSVSCNLCGRICSMLQTEFARKHKEKREIACTDCERNLAERSPFTCSACSHPSHYCRYWYVMKGMPFPTKCKLCKGKTKSDA